MTITTTDRAGTVDSRGRTGLARARPLASLLAVLPIWVSVVRYGMAGLTPTGDAALVVLRSRDVFSAHPPLAGMLAAGASGTGHSVYFPGAWQLYALAGPTWLFGNVWGPLIGMGVLNTIWVLLACWLLCRRLGTNQALLGIAFVAVYLWSIGSGFLISPVPMDMVLIPFVTFLVAVWCTATGDLVALPVLAVVANFLWLDHLVLVLLVPVIGLCAPVGLASWLWWQRRKSPEEFPPLKRRARRSVLWTAAITLVMWLPTLVQQVVARPGNLGLLFSTAGHDRASIGSWTTSVHLVIQSIARPPFWFRGSLDTPPYARRSLTSQVVGMVTLLDVVLGLALVVLVAGLLYAAHRRRDRVGLWALIVATAATLTAIPTVYLAPTTVGFPVNYLRSMSVVAMFLWFAVILNLIRMRPVRNTIAWGWAPVMVIVVVTALDAAPATFGYGHDERATRTARMMNQTVPPELTDGQPFVLVSGWGLDSQSYFAALALELDDRGIDYCVEPQFARQIGHRCSGLPPKRVVVRQGDPTDTPTGVVLFDQSLLSPREQAQLAGLDARMQRWLDNQRHLRLTPDTQRMLDDLGHSDFERQLRALIEPVDGDLTGIQDDRLFKLLIHISIERHGGKGVSPFVGSPLSGEDLLHWYELSDADQAVYVTENRT